MQNDLTRPIIGIQNRTAQEVFDIMSERIRLAQSDFDARIRSALVEDETKQNYNCPCIHPSQCDGSCTPSEIERRAEELEAMADVIMDSGKAGRLEAKVAMERTAKLLRSLGAPTPPAAPVAWQWQSSGGEWIMCEDEDAALRKIWIGKHPVRPLYSTPPAAAVTFDPDEWRDEMSAISSYLGAGMGDDQSTAAYLAKRIRWGIDEHVNGTIRMCAAVVERLSQKPYTTWGDIKSAILELAQSDAVHCAQRLEFLSASPSTVESRDALIERLVKALRLAKDHAELEDEVLDIVDDALAAATEQQP